MARFSIVIPIADGDLSLISRTLPSWLSLESDDVILSLDYPASSSVEREIRRVSAKYGRQDSVRIVQTERDSQWRFHQAHARRLGFERSKHDIILTGDIDLVVRRWVSKLADRVETDKIGLASCLRLPFPSQAPQVLRAWSSAIKQFFIPPVFSGLYAFRRSFWQETEDEGIKRLKNPARETYPATGPGLVGEDTYLYICMKRSHKCICVREIGAISLTRNVEDVPLEQYAWGRYLAATKVPWSAAALASIAFCYPYLFRGYLEEKSNPRKLTDPFAVGFKL